MARLFPRPVECAVRTLKKICDDPANSVPLRARAAELILHAYGLTTLPQEHESRYRSLKQIAQARVGVSEIDRELSQQIAEDRKQQKLNKQIDEVLKGK